MPSTQEAFVLASRILTRNESLTRAESVKLLNHAREMIKPHLGQITLGPLGEFQYPPEGNSLKFKQPQIFSTEDHFSLDTQGLFFNTHSDYPLSPDYEQTFPTTKTYAHKLMYIWGITRDGKWVLIEVILHIFTGLSKAIRITINETNPDELLSITRLSVKCLFHSLLHEIDGLVIDRGRLLEKAKKLQSKLHELHTILELVPEE